MAYILHMDPTACESGEMQASTTKRRLVGSQSYNLFRLFFWLGRRQIASERIESLYLIAPPLIPPNNLGEAEQTAQRKLTRTSFSFRM